MAVTELYNLRKNFAVRPLAKKEITSIRFYSDHGSLFTVEEKHFNTVITRTAYQNHELTGILAEWTAKGFTAS